MLALIEIPRNPGFFWLHDNCDAHGMPYTWLDGTPTDYMGPEEGTMVAGKKNI